MSGRYMAGVVLLSMSFVLTGCGTQEAGRTEKPAEEQKISVVEISPELLKYKNITYGEFQKESGREAEFLHATFYSAMIDEKDTCAVFSGEYDEELAGAVLTEDSECIRLEGRLGDLLTGFDEEMETREFAAAFVAAGESVPSYYEEEGAGTAYYPADRYVVVELDSDQDGEADTALEVSLDESEKITPDSYAWIRWNI